jgi:hypothetical protein
MCDILKTVCNAAALWIAIKLRKLYSLTIGEAHISDIGKTSINHLLEAHGLPYLPYDFDYSANIDKGELRGKFSKRVAQWLRKEHNCKLSVELKTEIGNLWQQNQVAPTTHYFDFTDSFNWQSGDFGDSGSCYWGSNADARPALENAGGLAIRFYDDATGEDGIGRAWIIERKFGIVVFNGYGDKDGEDYSTLEVAKILAHAAGLSYKRIDLHNYGACSDTLYINGGRGYLINSVDKLVSAPNSIDLRIEVETECACDHCSAFIDPDNSYADPDGNTLCEECYSERVAQCACCGNDVWQDDTTYFESEERCVCSRCLRRYYSQCRSCNEYVSDNDTTELGGDSYCEACADGLRECEECGEVVSADECDETPDGRVLCADCFAPNYVACADCEKVVSRDNSPDGLCGDCAADSFFARLIVQSIFCGAGS